MARRGGRQVSAASRRRLAAWTGWRSAALIAAAISLSLLAAAIQPAAAQDPQPTSPPVTLLLGSEHYSFDQFHSTDHARSRQAFRTGPSPSGYRLTSISVPIQFHLGNHLPIRAQLYSTAGVLLRTFDNPSNIPSAISLTVRGDWEFTLPDGELLQPSTEYKFEINFTRDVRVSGAKRMGFQQGGDEVGAPGWSLVDNAVWYDETGQTPAFPPRKKLRLHIKGSVVPGVSLAPRSLSAQSRDSNAIALTWQAPLLDGGSPLTGYQIEFSEAELGNWRTLVADTGSTATSYRHDGLELADSWKYRVRAINAEGVSAASDERTATVDPEGLGTLLREAGTIAAGDTIGFVSLMIGGDEVSQAFRTGPHPSGAALRAVRVFRASAELKSGYFGLGAHLHADIDGVPGPALARLTVTPARSGDSIYLIASGAVALEPSKTYHVVISYPTDSIDSLGLRRQVVISTDGEPGWRLQGLLTRSAATGTWTPAAGEIGPLRLGLYGSAGRGRPSEPRQLRARSSQPGRVELSWFAPLADGGEAISSYLLEISDNGEDWRVLDTGPWMTRYTDADSPGLYPGAQRLYRVYALNARGRSPASTPARVQVSGTSQRDTDLLAANGVPPPGGSVDDILDLSWEFDANVPRRSLRFTTGASPSGYRLDQLLIAMAGGRLRNAAIHDDQQGEPGRLRYRLRPSLAPFASMRFIDSEAVIDEEGVGQRFAAPADAALRASTTYHVVFDHTLSPGSNLTDVFRGSQGMRSRGEAGWRFAEQGLEFQLDQGAGGAWVESDPPLIELRGAAGGFAPSVKLSNQRLQADAELTLTGDGPALAQAFRTGAGSPGQLDWVSFDVDPQRARDLAVHLHAAAADGRPGERLQRLRASTLAESGALVFAAPPGAQLEPNRTYYLVVRADHGQISLGATSGANEYAADAWRIEDGHRRQTSRTSETWSSAPDAHSLRLTVATLAEGLPERPLALVATPEDGARVRLRWQAPAGGATVVSHRIEWSADGGEPWSALGADLLPDATAAAGDCPSGRDCHEYTDAAIAGGETRHYRIRAFSRAGASRRASDPATATVCCAVANLVPTPRRLDGVQLRSAGEAGDITGAAQSFTTGTHQAGYLLEAVALQLSQHRPGGLDVSLHADADGAPGSELIRLTAPATGSAGTVEFAAPAGVGLSAGTRYHVVVRATAGTHQLASTGSDAEDPGGSSGWSIGDALSVTEPDTTPEWRTRPAALAMRVRAAPLARPAAPSALTATVRAAGQTVLRWRAPDDGGSTLTGYRIEFSADGSTWTVLVADTGNRGTSFQDSARRPDRQRRYRVRAINALGVSPPSAAVSASALSTRPAAETLLSNLEIAPGINLKLFVQPYGGDPASETNHGFEWSQLSQGFRTGPALVGLDAVRIDQVAIGPDELFALAIHDDDAGQPGRRLYLLDGPVPEAGARKAFFAPPGSVLEPHTDYQLVVSHQRGLLGIGATAEPAEHGRSGWRIADHSSARRTQAGDFAVQQRHWMLRLAIEGYDLPSAPRVTELRAEPFSDSAIRLDWDVQQEFAVPVDGYRVESSRDGIRWRELAPPDQVATTEYIHRGLFPGSTRYYRVTAQTALGDAEPSAVRTANSLGDTLVSNLGGEPAVGLTPDPAYDAYAQPFRTGPGAGVRLEAVELELDSLGTVEPLALALHEVDRRNSSREPRPGAERARFRAVGPLSENRYLFVLPRPLELERNTDYQLVLLVPSGSGFRLAATAEAGDDAGAAPGWSLGDEIYARPRLDRWAPLPRGSGLNALRLRLVGRAPLSPPQALAAQAAAGDGPIRVSWQPGRFKAGMTGFQLEVSEGPGDDWMRLAELPPSARPVFDHAVSDPALRRRYRVRALGPEGQSAPSAVVTLRPPITNDAARLLFSNAPSPDENYYAQFVEAVQSEDVGPHIEGPSVTRLAQGFRTGPEPGGYWLDKISIFVRRAPQGPSDLFPWSVMLVKRDAGPIDAEPFWGQGFLSSATQLLVHPLHPASVFLSARQPGVYELIPEQQQFPLGEKLTRLTMSLLDFIEDPHGEIFTEPAEIHLEPETVYYLVIDFGDDETVFEGQVGLVAGSSQNRHVGRIGWSPIPVALAVMRRDSPNTDNTDARDTTAEQDATRYWRICCSPDTTETSFQGIAAEVPSFRSEDLFSYPTLRFELFGRPAAAEPAPGGLGSGPPGAPPQLNARLGSPSTVWLAWTWSAAEADSGGPLDGFLVESSSDRLSWSEIGRVAATTREFFDAFAAPGRRIFYRIRAHGPGGASEPSPVASVLLGPAERPTEYLFDNLGETSEEQLTYLTHIEIDQGERTLTDVAPLADFTQRFWTGDNPGGYRLDRITLDIPGRSVGFTPMFLLIEDHADLSSVLTDIGALEFTVDVYRRTERSLGGYRLDPTAGSAGSSLAVFAATGSAPLLKPNTAYQLSLELRALNQRLDSDNERITEAGSLKLATAEPAATEGPGGWNLEPAVWGVSGSRVAGESNSFAIRVWRLPHERRGAPLAIRMEGVRIKAPEKPALIADTQPDGDVLLSWTAAIERDGVEITGYELQYWREDRWIKLASLSGREATEYRTTDSADFAADEREYRVRVLTASGYSEWSEVVSPAPPSGAPQPPQMLGFEPMEPSVTGPLTLTWKASDRSPEAQSYLIEWSADEKDDKDWIPYRAGQVAHMKSDDGNQTWTVPKEIRGPLRFYRVRAVNQAGRSQPSAYVQVESIATAAPGPPTGLTAGPKEGDPSKIELNWDAPADHGSSCLTSYLVERSSDLGVSWQIQPAISPAAQETPAAGPCHQLPDEQRPATSAVDGNVPADATYLYRVRSVSPDGVSEPSLVAGGREAPGAPIRLALDTTLHTGRARIADQHGMSQQVLGFQAPGRAAPIGLLDERSFTLGGQLFTIEAIRSVEPLPDGQDADPAAAEPELELALSYSRPAGDSGPLKTPPETLSLYLDGVRFELSQAERAEHYVDTGEEAGQATLRFERRYRWPAGDLRLTAETASSLQIGAPLTAGPYEGSPVQGELPADGRWYSFQTADRAIGFHGYQLRTFLDVDHRYRVEFRLDPTGISAEAIAQGKHWWLSHVFRSGGNFIYATDATLYLGSVGFVPAGRMISLDTSGRYPGSPRVGGHYFVVVDLSRGSHPSVLGSRFWVRIVASSQGIAQRTYSEAGSGHADFPDNHETPGRLVPGEPASGRADSRQRDADMYRLSLRAGVTYLIRASGASSPLLNLQRPGRSSDELLADAGSIIYTPSVSGVHYVRVRNHSSAGDQRYTITAAPLGLSQPSWITALNPGRSGQRTGYASGCYGGQARPVLPPGGPLGLDAIEHRNGQLVLSVRSIDIPPGTTLLGRGNNDSLGQAIHPAHDNLPYRLSQPIRAGALDHELEAIELDLARVDSGDDLSVAIHADENGQPAAQPLFTFALTPGESPADGRNRFLATEMSLLRACAVYHLVLTSLSGELNVQSADHSPSDGTFGFSSDYGWSSGGVRVHFGGGSTIRFPTLNLRVGLIGSSSRDQTTSVGAFDWLSIGGAAFGSGTAERTEQGRRYTWPAPDAPWTVGQWTQARFYQAAAEGAALWSGVLEAGQESGHDSGQDPDGARSGAPAGDTCNPAGRLYHDQPDERGLSPRSLEYQNGQLVLTFDGHGDGPLALSGFWPAGERVYPGASISLLGYGDRLLVQPFRSGPQTDTVLSWLQLRISNYDVEDFVDYMLVRGDDPDGPVSYALQPHPGTPHSDGTPTTFRPVAGQTIPIEPCTDYLLVIRDPNYSARLDLYSIAADSVAGRYGWRLGPTYHVGFSNVPSTISPTHVLELQLSTEPVPDDGPPPEFHALQIGGQRFPAAEAADVTDDGRRYTWSAEYAPWTLGDPVAVSLRTEPEQPDPQPQSQQLALKSRKAQDCATQFPGSLEPPPAGAYCPGQTLEADRSALDRALPAGTSYQWFRIEDGLHLELVGARDARYQLGARDVGHRIYVRLTDPGTGDTWRAGPSAPIASRPNRPAAAPLKIMRVSRDELDPNSEHFENARRLPLLLQGDTLAADGADQIMDPDGLSSALPVRYQWYRHRPYNDPEGSPIGGATGKRYVIGSEDRGHLLSVRISVTDDLGRLETLTSARTSGTIEAPLTVSAVGQPGVHDVQPFSVQLQFAEDVTIGFAELRQALEISGGEIIRARRVDGRADLREIRIAPRDDGRGERVVISLPAAEPDADCTDEQGAVVRICSAGGQRLHEPFELRIPGPASQPPSAPWKPRDLQRGVWISRDGIRSEFSWRPPAYFGGSRLTGYRFEFKRVDDAWDDDVDVVSFLTDTGAFALPDATTTTPLTRISYEKLYPGPVNFRVAAINDRGTGPWSEELTWTVPDLVRPGEATGLRVSFDDSTGDAQLSWTPPADDGGEPIRAYLVEWGPHNDDVVDPANPMLRNAAIAYEAAYTVPHVGAGLTYRFVVSAVNLVGKGPFSVGVHATFPEPSSTGPQANRPATGDVSIEGTARVGQTLAAGHAISDRDGTSQAVYAYQWLAGDAEIAGATGSSYTLTAAEAGRPIRVRISFSDDQGHAESLTSGPTAAVNTPASGRPTITGEAEVGRTLGVDVSAIADADGLNPAAFRYQWFAGADAIAGATGDRFTLSDAQDGLPITVQVSFTDDAGQAESATSRAVGTRRPTQLSARFVPGEGVELTWNAAPGIAFPLDYRIQRATPEIAESPVIRVETGDLETSYTDADIEAGALYRYQVQASNIWGLYYALSEAVEIRIPVALNSSRDSVAPEPAVPDELPDSPPESPPGEPLNLSARVNDDGAIELSWAAPADAAEASITGYQILRRRPRDGEPSLLIYVSDSGSSDTTYTDSEAPPGTLYVYRVKAINAAGIGPQSNFVNVDH